MPALGDRCRITVNFYDVVIKELLTVTGRATVTDDIVRCSFGQLYIAAVVRCSSIGTDKRQWLFRAVVILLCRSVDAAAAAADKLIDE